MDFYDRDEIDDKDFYNTIKGVPEFIEGANGLKEGDIMDLIDYFDENKNGYIKLDLLKDNFNSFIGDQN